MRLSSVFVALSVLFSASCAIEGASVSEGQLAAPCKGSGCALVAVETTWPKGFVDARVQGIRFDRFRFFIPAGAKLSFFSLGAVLIADYGDKRINFSYEYSQHFQKESAVDRSGAGKLTLADYPRILFTKTVSDPEPKLIYDRLMWRDAMYGKGLYFEKTKAAFVARTGTVTAYYAETPSSSYRFTAYVTDAERSTFYLLVQIDGFDFNTFEKIVGSLRKEG